MSPHQQHHIYPTQHILTTTITTTRTKPCLRLVLILIMTLFLDLIDLIYQSCQRLSPWRLLYLKQYLSLTSRRASVGLPLYGYWTTTQLFIATFSVCKGIYLVWVVSKSFQVNLIIGKRHFSEIFRKVSQAQLLEQQPITAKMSLKPTEHISILLRHTDYFPIKIYSRHKVSQLSSRRLYNSRHTVWKGARYGGVITMS